MQLIVTMVDRLEPLRRCARTAAALGSVDLLRSFARRAVRVVADWALELPSPAEAQVKIDREIQRLDDILSGLDKVRQEIKERREQLRYQSLLHKLRVNGL